MAHSGALGVRRIKRLQELRLRVDVGGRNYDELGLADHPVAVSLIEPPPPRPCLQLRHRGPLGLGKRRREPVDLRADSVNEVPRMGEVGSGTSRSWRPSFIGRPPARPPPLLPDRQHGGATVRGMDHAVSLFAPRLAAAVQRPRSELRRSWSSATARNRSLRVGMNRASRRSASGGSGRGGGPPARSGQVLELLNERRELRPFAIGFVGDTCSRQEPPHRESLGSRSAARPPCRTSPCRSESAVGPSGRRTPSRPERRGCCRRQGARRTAPVDRILGPAELRRRESPLELCAACVPPALIAASTSLHTGLRGRLARDGRPL